MGDATSTLDTISDLRRRVARTTVATEIAGTTAVEPGSVTGPLPTDPDLAGLLPGGLRRGATYALSGSTSLLFRVLAPVTAAGQWCGLVGLPDLGYEAAAQAGVDLDRLVVVPAPGRGWLGVLSTLADALALVVVRPPEAPTPAVAARLAARLRHQGGTLLVVGRAGGQQSGRGARRGGGVWPQTAATITVEEHRWQGLAAGHGYLTEHALTVAVADRSGVRRTGVLRG